jgi:serine/threonine protein phosphatase 1
MRQFVIGDVHGCKVSLVALLKKIDLQFGDELYFLGDYIDRGPDSKGVFDTIFTLKNAGYKVICLRGNHEAMMYGSYLGYANDTLDWRKNGGETTLRSFNTYQTRDVPDTYIDFIESMPLVLEVGDYILVHGGLNFKSNDPLHPTQQMIWIRNWYDKINYKWLGNRYILHGHTPKNALETICQFENLESDRVLNLDCGCVFNTPFLNTLACFELNSKQLYFQENIERMINEE